MRISDWSSDVCSSDLTVERFIDGIEPDGPVENLLAVRTGAGPVHFGFAGHLDVVPPGVGWTGDAFDPQVRGELLYGRGAVDMKGAIRSEEHTSELQSLMRISYAVFCLKKKTNKNH